MTTIADTTPARDNWNLDHLRAVRVTVDIGVDATCTICRKPLDGIVWSSAPSLHPFWYVCPGCRALVALGEYIVFREQVRSAFSLAGRYLDGIAELGAATADAVAEAADRVADAFLSRASS